MSATPIPFACPACHGDLTQAGEALSCRSCAAEYPIRFGIPDLRQGAAVEVDRERDRYVAAELAALEPKVDADGLRERFYELRPAASDENRVRHDRHFGFEADRAARLVITLATGSVLEMGCGHGQYLRAAATRGLWAVGVDASLGQLIMARRLLADAGLTAQLAAADVEFLPFPDNSFDSAIATDVIEHVRAPEKLVSEAHRTLRSGGKLWLTTPNRFSLTAEPHVGVWGVGWLPRGLGRRYVQSRTGIDYRWIQLLSLGRLRQILRRSFGQIQIRPPRLTNDELAEFSPAKRFAGRVFLALTRLPLLRSFVLRVGPYFEASCIK